MQNISHTHYPKVIKLVRFNKNWSVTLLSLASGFPLLFTKCFLGFGMNLMAIFDGEWG